MHPDRIVIGVVRRGVRRPDRGALRRVRCARCADERRVRGDDQARRERVPRDEDQLHQRDRERVGGGRRERRRGRVRHGPRPADRDELPQTGHRLRRELLPQGRVLLEAARREQWLPLPARERRDRGQRPPEAAYRDEAPAAARQPARQDDRAPRARVQAGHGRHARGAVARARGAAAGRRSGVRAWDPLVKCHPVARRRRHRSFAARRGAGCRRRHDRDRVARVRGPRFGRSAGRDAHAADRRRPEPARRRSGARGRVRLRGHRPGLRENRPRGSCSSRRREGRAARRRG